MAICGIDLGTTNSLVSIISENRPQLVPNAHGEYLTPSAVSIDDDGSVLVGKAAKERLITHPDLSVASFKRLMGTGNVQKLGRQNFRPEELSSLVLRALREDAETFTGKTVDEAIISVPAYFNDHQRRATIDAGRLAGLRVERVVNEPTAAALAYGIQDQRDGCYLVFDLGGGTFDVSILDKYDGLMEIRATAGDTSLGGNDFTGLIEAMIASAHGVDLTRLERSDFARLRRLSEEAKFALTREKNFEYSFEVAETGMFRKNLTQVSGEVSRAEFERQAFPLLNRLRVPVERAISDSRLSLDALDAVVMVGGATRMPMVRSLVARLFGRLPLVTLDPDTIVALGAGVQAALKTRNTAFEDVVMTDVCPFTLGIEAVEREMQQSSPVVTPIIERNAVVPISRSKVFSAIHLNQEKVDIKVYQGENLYPDQNVFIGNLLLKLPHGTGQREAVEVRFTYDINGALEVESTILSTGQISSRVFRNNSGMSDVELEARFTELQHLKLHPRDQAANKALIARAERIYAEQIGEGREHVKRLLAAFAIAAESQFQRDMEEIRRQFSVQLDAIERRPVF